MSTDTNVEHGYRIWRSGDDLLLAFNTGPAFVLSRDEALALAAEMAGSYTPAIPAKRRHSTAEERAEICRLYKEGLGVAEIARRANVQAATIYQILHRAGIPAHDQKRSARVKRQMAKRRAA